MVVSYPLLQNMVTLGQNQAVRSQVTERSLYSPHFPGSLPEPSDMIRNAMWFITIKTNQVDQGSPYICLFTPTYSENSIIMREQNANFKTDSDSGGSE
jgi:hypothetical protein